MKSLLFGFFSPATLLSHCAWGKLGEYLVQSRTTFLGISDLTIITLPMRGYVPYVWKVGGKRAKCLKSWVLESRKMEFESQLCHLVGDI